MKATRTILFTALLAAAAWATPASAHCDALDGPVVKAAQQALATGRVEHALVWVRKDDEKRIRDAFTRARATRSGAADAGAVDRAFYATLVRVHREGEGERYTGLKPAGGIAPPVAAADEALARGSSAALERMLAERAAASVHERFEDAHARRDFDPADVDAGRRYVAAYVTYVHHVERLHDLATDSGHAHAAHATQPGAKPADGHAGHAAPAKGHDH